MPAPSLRSLATATAMRYVKVMDDLGALPYALARPILLKVDNPHKLHALELASPHLAEEDAEVWLEFIKRDVPQWEQYHLPKQSNDWFNIYLELRAESERSLDADAQILKRAIDGINNKRADLAPQLIPQNKSHRMAHAKPTTKQRHAAYDRKMGGIEVAYNIPRSSESRKKSSIFQPVKRNTALTVPTKTLNNRASQVQRAPRALVEEHQESRRPAQAKINAPKAGPPSSLQRPGLAKNEDKLRALTGNAAQGANPNLKRRATSPPPPPSSSSRPAPHPPLSSHSSGPPTSGPVMRRRPPPSIFMPPKRRRV